jgi:hypothetical protein
VKRDSSALSRLSSLDKELDSLEAESTNEEKNAEKSTLKTSVDSEEVVPNVSKVDKIADMSVSDFFGEVRA